MFQAINHNVLMLQRVAAVDLHYVTERFQPWNKDSQHLLHKTNVKMNDKISLDLRTNKIVVRSENVQQPQVAGCKYSVFCEIQMRSARCFFPVTQLPHLNSIHSCLFFFLYQKSYSDMQLTKIAQVDIFRGQKFGNAIGCIFHHGWLWPNGQNCLEALVYHSCVQK